MTKPTDGALQLAEGVLCGIDDQFAPFASGTKHSPAQAEALATRIDKVAVAPAVRELGERLKYARRFLNAGDHDVRWIDDCIYRYRHLIEESE